MPDDKPFPRILYDDRRGPWLLRRDFRLDRLLVPEPPGIVVPPPRRRVLRADDHLLLELVLHGLAVERAPDGPLLSRQAAVATLVAHFPPQAIAEETFADVSLTDQPSPLPPGALPSAARHAGTSRVAVRMPVDVESIPYTTESVLDALATWPPVLVARRSAGLVDHADTAALTALARALAAELPDEHAERAAAISDRIALRAAVEAHHDPSPATALEALGRVSDQVDAAARTLALDDDQRTALATMTELRFAARLVDRLAPSTVIDVLPGLWRLYQPREPEQDVTAIELPYRLVQSPSATAGFSHARTPVTRAGRTELWHSRLGERVAGEVVDATETEASLAAVWSPDYDPHEPVDEPGFPTSLTDRHRDHLVRLTADETARTGRRRHVPVPARAHRLMLTALGGWLDAEGRWRREDAPLDKHGHVINLISWKHHAALGREWFVEVVEVGRLAPLGHRSVHVTQTERRFQDAPDGSGRVAVLRTKSFVEPLERLRTYPDPTQPFAGRDFPYRSVEILTDRTPNLLPVADPLSFWPRIGLPAGDADFRFDLRATDDAGGVARFDLPLRFVADGGDVAAAIAAYNNADQLVEGRTTAPLHGQPVLLAPPALRTDAAGDPDPGDVVYPLDTIRLGANPPTVPPPADGTRTPVHPFLRTLRIFSTTLTQMTGNAGSGGMSYAPVYRDHGFDPGINKAELLLSAAPDGEQLESDFAERSSADKAGGIVTPDFGVTGTSRAFGLVGGDIDLLAGGTFSPDSYFPHAKIFGGIDLKDVLAPAVVALAGAVVPKLRTTRTKEKIESVFELHVEHVPKSAPLLRMNERGTSTLDVKAGVTAFFKVADPSVGLIGSGPGAAGGNPPGLKEPEAFGSAKLTWFKFNFFGCVIVSFDAFTFTANSTTGVKADPKLAAQDAVVFGGPLAFVDTLRHLLSGHGGGPSLPGFEVSPIFKPTPTSLTVGVKLGLPKIVVGVFTLKNLMVRSAVKIPFGSESLSLELGFAERVNPFQLTVGMFGGGGFIVIVLDAEHGVRELEAALEFGAYATMDFGVASGAIYAKAGIYIAFNEPDHTTTLKGYVELGGEVQVLGLVSVSITLHVSLGYYKVGAASEVRGQATLVIEIEILFFSASVNLTVERRFGGSDADPGFADLIPGPDVWADYADAFA